MHNTIDITRLAVLSILLIFSTVNSYAQSKYEVGLGFAINTSKFRLQVENAAFLSDPGASFATNYNLRISYKIEPETKLNFSPGLRFLNARNPLTFSRYTSTFIEFPLEIQQYIGHSLGVDVSISAGLSASYLTKLKNDGLFPFGSAIVERDITDQAERRVFLNPKFGIQVKLGSKFEFGFIYEHYTQALVEADPEGLSRFMVSNASLRHTNIQLSIFYIDIFGE